MKKKLAIVTTHPVQYNAPLFELLTQRNNIELKIFYTWGDAVLQNKFDPGFGKVINWDIPLLNGYTYEFLENASKDKGSHNYTGIVNPKIIASIKHYNPDALLVYGWPFKSHLWVLRFFKNKVPIFFRGDSTLIDNHGFFVPLIRTVFLKWVYSHIDFALYTGKNNLAYFKKAGLKKEQLIFAPHAIDNGRFCCETSSCKNDSDNFLKELHIPSKDFIFLFAGKLEEKKDPSTLLKAFVAAGFTENVHLVLAGNGPLENGLKKGYGLCKNIHFIDFQNQSKMPAVYNIASVFVLPSKGPGETWGLAVNEAMANGKPVIVSDHCGCAIDLVEENVNGYTCKAGDVNDLREKLILMHTNKNLCEMQLQSRSKIGMYSLSNLCDAVEKSVMALG